MFACLKNWKIPYVYTHKGLACIKNLKIILRELVRSVKHSRLLRLMFLILMHLSIVLNGLLFSINGRAGHCRGTRGHYWCVLKRWQVKLFPNFTNIPFDYLLISWLTNYVSTREFLTCSSCIVSIENSTLSLNVSALNLAKFRICKNVWQTLPVRILLDLLDVLFRVFRFSKASVCALTSSFTAF